MTGVELTGHYDTPLVALSVAVAIVSAFFALLLSEQAARLVANPASRRLVLAAGALSLGCGIWAMHFIGMLAFDLSIPVSYDTAVTLGSMVPSVGASAIALGLVSRPSLTTRQVWLGGTLMGGGIGLMHYSGMAAMRMAPTLKYHPGWFTLSIVAAVGLATCSLWLQQWFRRQKRLPPVLILAVAAVAMGLAISAMHYLGMAAAEFVAPEGIYPAPRDDTDLLLHGLSIAVISMLITVLVAGLSAYVAQTESAKLLKANERRLTELVSHLQEREVELQRFASIIEGSSDGIASKTLDGTVTSWNPGAEKIFGYTAEEMVGRSILTLFPPDRIDEEAQFIASIRQGQPVKNYETVRLHKSGRPIDVSVNLSPIRDAQGQVVGASKIVRDITEHKQAEGLKRARDEAERRAEARTALLANISHELRTPMNAILGYAQLLERTPLAPDQKKHLGTLTSSAEFLLRMVNDIVDASRLERGVVQLQQADFAPRETLHGLYALFQPAAQEKGLEFDITVSASVPALVQGDELRLRQLLSNLLANAVKFTAAGRIDVHAEVEGGHLQISVSDTGSGMSPEELERITHAFEQADTRHTRRHGGLGLGITIARQLALLMQGELTLTSAPGQGTTARLTLPCLPARGATGAQATAPSAPDAPNAAAAPTALKLLIVDDVPLNLKVLGKMLMECGHKVAAVNSGAAALQAFQKGRFDAILMDIQMPEMTGLEATDLIRRLEAKEKRPPTPVIAVTASTLMETREAAQQAGMNGFIAKPISIESLQQELARVLHPAGA